MTRSGIAAAALLCAVTMACTTSEHTTGAYVFEVVGEAELFAPGVATTEFAELRLTISPDGETALWFSRNRPGGAGGYDIWMSRRTASGWSQPEAVSFNTAYREFDPAFSADGRYVYFCSDRPGGVGGDDIYRAPVTAAGFGDAENLGAGVNSAGNEWAPMFSRRRLLFASNGRGGAGGFDLFLARERDRGFEAARVLGSVNTAADEFDATFLADGETIIFSRAPALQTDRIDLFYAFARGGAYDGGVALPIGVNHGERDTYAPMLDWSAPDRFSFSGQRTGDRGMDLYLVRYRLARTR